MSYLHNRTECADKPSLDIALLYIYQTTVVGEIIKRHNIKYHCYGDNTQVYMIWKPCHKWDDISSSIEACIEDISIWINSNMLKLKKDKSEFIVFSSKQYVKKTENLNIKVESSYIFFHIYKKL